MPKICIVVLSLVVVFCTAGCSKNLPQRELTFTGKLNDEQRRSAEKKPWLASKSLRAKAAKENRAQLYEKLEVKTADFEAEESLAGLGFIPGTADAYAVYRDGTAGLILEGGEVIKLDKLSERIDRVKMGGRAQTVVLGLASHGSQAAWDSADLSRQLTLRPQKTTFGQARVYDSKPIKHSHYLAAATEGGLLELWSLVSGNIANSVRFEGVQPREIARNNQGERIIFGTNSGEVRFWSGNDHSHVLYTHAGPVLEIVNMPRRGLIASSAKDGTLKIYSKRAKRVLYARQFSKALYRIVVSKNERWVVAIPATGLPVAFNLDEEGLATSLYKFPVHTIEKAEFLPGDQYMLIKYASKGVFLWDMRGREPVQGAFVSSIEDGAKDFHIAQKAKISAVLQGERRIGYWDPEYGRIMGGGLISARPVERFAISEDGRWLLAGLVGGGLVRMRVMTGREFTIPVE